MKTKETLSDKVIKSTDIRTQEPLWSYEFVKKEDVKEFIRELKEFEWTKIFVKEREQNMIDAYKLTEFFDKLDKLAGDKLI